MDAVCVRVSPACSDEEMPAQSCLFSNRSTCFCLFVSFLSFTSVSNSGYIFKFDFFFYCFGLFFQVALNFVIREMTTTIYFFFNFLKLCKNVNFYPIVSRCFE